MKTVMASHILLAIALSGERADVHFALNAPKIPSDNTTSDIRGAKRVAQGGPRP